MVKGGLEVIRQRTESELKVEARVSFVDWAFSPALRADPRGCSGADVARSGVLAGISHANSCINKGLGDPLLLVPCVLYEKPWADPLGIPVA